MTSLFLYSCVPLFWIGHGITNKQRLEHKLCLSVSTLSGNVYMSEKPTLPDFIRTNRSPVGSRRTCGQRPTARPLPVDTLERSCGPDVDVIETGPDLEHTQGVPNGSCANPPQPRLSRG